MKYVLIDNQARHVSPPLTPRQIELWCRENHYVASPLAGTAVVRSMNNDFYVIVSEPIAARLVLKKITGGRETIWMPRAGLGEGLQ